MRLLRCCSLTVSLCLAIIPVAAQPASTIHSIHMSGYSVEITPGDPPRLTVARDSEAVFELPIVSGLASGEKPEHLSNIQFSIRKNGDLAYELNATAKSSLWSERRFQWRFLPDHIEFQQFASGTASWDAATSSPTEFQTAGTMAAAAGAPGQRRSTPTATSRPAPTTPTSLNSTSPCPRPWGSVMAARAVPTPTSAPSASPASSPRRPCSSPFI